jgi:DEAD/DEAH box helicase domain-containing protein
VVTTSALELGIDVGGLDAIVTFGWPRTLASFWQQAGRAGRKLQDSLVVFVGFADALDQYLLRHPEVILQRDFESAVVDLTNPYVVKGHLLCAASESPLREEELGPAHRALIEELERDLLLSRIPAPQPVAARPSPIDNRQSEIVGSSAWVYTGRDRPQEKVQLEAIEEHSVDILCSGRVLETVDRTRARREAHPGAVLLHMGETYLVKSLDLEAGRAEAEAAPVDYYTSVIQREESRLLETLEQREPSPGFRLSLGRLQVTERFTGYQVKRGDRVVSTHSLSLPPVEFPTVGLWLEILLPPASDSSLVSAGGLHGAEHALIGLAPLVAMCDPMDIGGTSYSFFPDTRSPTVLIYDGYENGIGISEKLFAEFDRLSRTAFELVRDCGCDNGCPACILSPRCGDNNKPMDKPAALALLRQLGDGAAWQRSAPHVG